jgi:O-methyltransferase domain/Dimerisation domain
VTTDELDSRTTRSDASAIFEACYGIFGYAAVLIGYRHGLFGLFKNGNLTLEEIAEALNWQPRPTETVLTAAMSLGLLQCADDRYALTPVAQDYLLDSSPLFFGPILDLTVASETLSYDAIERAISTGSAQSPTADMATFEEQADRARFFTRAMHGVSYAPALAWPDHVDLSGARILLDVGGGSGAHSIGACLRWPELRAVVLDQPAVCDVAEEFAAGHSLQSRISTHPADMWVDPFPPADVHFYSNILHDWPADKNRFLVHKSFDALDPGGRIVIHEALLNDDKAGPFSVAAFSVAMVALTEGRQYSGQELRDILLEAGFTDINVTPTFAPYSIVTGAKP